MPDGQAKIIVGASEVAGDRRHTYLIFENVEGQQTVVRGGPDARGDGDDLANFAGSTVLGSNNFGNIRVEAADYCPPYEAVFQRQSDGTVKALHADRANVADPALVRGANGEAVRRQQTSPDWPSPGEHHERLIVWTGTDAEMQAKLGAALRSGRQINDASLEYSPLYNNSNGVTSNLLKAAGLPPALPRDRHGDAVKAPDFGENLFQEVGLASHRSGYSFDGKQWTDEQGTRIQPPQAGQPLVPLAPGVQHNGSLKSESSRDTSAPLPQARADMRDPSHGDFAMYRHAYENIARIDQALGRAPDQYTERFAAAVTAQGKADGLRDVQHVVMNDDRSRAYAVDTPGRVFTIWQTLKRRRRHGRSAARSAKQRDATRDQCAACTLGANAGPDDRSCTGAGDFRPTNDLTRSDALPWKRTQFQPEIRQGKDGHVAP